MTFKLAQKSQEICVIRSTNQFICTSSHLSTMFTWPLVDAFLDYAIPMEKGAYNGLIPVDQLPDAEEGLKETKGHRHSNLNKGMQQSTSMENGDVDPASVQMKEESSNDETECSKNSVFYSADLKGGRNSGLFTRFGRVDDVKDCIQKCCRTPRCDLAYMDKSICYTVICHFPSLCQPIRAAKSHITLGYVSRKGETVYDPGIDHDQYVLFKCLSPVVENFILKLYAFLQ